MQLIISFFLYISLLFFVCLNSNSFSEAYYHKKESGVKVYTNIKPKGKGYKKFYSKWGRDKSSSKRNKYSLGSFEYSDKYDHLIQLAAKRYRLDPRLIKAMIKVESNFYQGAISPKGAIGVMQLMPQTAEKLGVRNPLDPVENIMGGSKYLRELLDMFDNDRTLALAGYNAGENAVIQYGYSIPPYRETQNYVKKVFAHYRYLNKTKLKTAEKKTKVAKKQTEGESDKPSISYKETLDSVEINPVPKKSKVIVQSVEYVEKTGANKNKISYNEVNSNEGEYTVQIASFPSFESAKEMEESLKSKTYPAYIKVARLDDEGTWYRVRVGEFSSEHEALLFAESLKREQPYIKSAFVTTN